MPFEYYTNPNHVKDIEIEREREVLKRERMGMNNTLLAFINH